MSLALYTDTFWFPSGVVAANTPARVFPRNSTTLASLYADINGTIPLPNPLDTDGSGVLTFYADAGPYWVHIDTESFLVDVGLSQEQADLSTGVASGLNLNINAGNPQAVDILPFTGYIVDNTAGTPVAPVITPVDYPGGTVVLSGASLTRPVTFLLMDAAGTVTQQGTNPTPDQYRTSIVLGGLFYNPGTGQIIEAQTLPTILPQPANQLVDLMNSLGPFSVSGNRFSPNGTNLMLNKASGDLFARAFNYVDPLGVYGDNPHRKTSPSMTPVSFRRITQVTTPVPPPLVTTVDPANYDLGGVITPVGGGTGSSTIQRIWLFASDDVSTRVAVQYGQTVYGSLAAAVDAVGSGSFVPAPIAALATLSGYLCLTRAATDLTNLTQAVFVHAGKFATP